MSSQRTFPCQTPPHFPFLRLPAELREHIYRSYFDNLNNLKTGSSTQWSQEASQSLRLLRVNSQIRKEACHVFYKEFIGHAPSSDPHCWILPSHDNLTTIKRLQAMSRFLAEYSPDAEIAVRFLNEGRLSYQVFCFIAALLASLYSRLPRSDFEESLRQHATWLFRRNREPLPTPFKQTIKRLTIDCKATRQVFSDRHEIKDQITIAGPFAMLDLQELESRLDMRWPFGCLRGQLDWDLRTIQTWQSYTLCTVMKGAAK